MANNFTNFDKGITLLPQGSAPSSPSNGDLYYDSVANKLKVYENGSFVNYLQAGAASIVNADISASAAIALSKLAAVTASRLLVSDGSGLISVSAVTSTEAGYLSGVTSAIQTQLNARALDSIVIKKDGSVAFTADQSMGSNKITNLTDPTSAQDAATKAYVDNGLAGLTWKNAARVASVANVNVASAPASIDGVTLSTNDRILLKDQSTGSQNGIYTFNGAASALVRATDMDSWAEVVGAVLLVTEGTVNAGSKWVNTNIAGGTFGTTAITFTAFSVAGNVSGTGTSNYVAYWSGTSTLTSEQFLSASRGGLGADASGFTGVLKATAGTFSASSIVNADVDAAAAIAYSKLNLSGSIVNADINASAAIAYSKLNLSASIVNADVASGAAIAYAKLNLSASIVNADVASGAAIAYSKLALTASIVNADIASGAAIAYAKLNLTNSVVDGDLVTLYLKADGSRSLTGPLTQTQQTTPANPSAGSNKLYFKADDKVYTLDSAGNEVQLAASGSGVSGPGTSTVNAVPRYSNTSGNALLNSAVLIDSSNNVSGIVDLTSSGQVLSADGSASAPSYSFSGDVNTGLYRIGADNFGFATAGVTVGNISSTGLWTIGPVQPTTVTHFINGRATVSTSTAGGVARLRCEQTDNTNTANRAELVASVAGSASGDAQVQMIITGAQTWTMGADNSAGDNFKLSASASLGTTDILDISAAGDVLIAGATTTTGLVKRGASTSTSVEEQYFDSLSLTASTTAVLSSLTFDSRNYKGMIVEYTITNGNNRRIGKLSVVCDNLATVAASNVSLTDSNNETANVNVSWAAAINGNNIELSYTTSTGTTTMKADVKRFIA